MKQNVEFNCSVENKSLTKVVPNIPITNFSTSIKSQIAQMYLNHFGGTSNLIRPSTINSTENRTKRNQSQEIQKNRRSEPLINLALDKKNLLDEEYPSIVLHPKQNRYIFETIKKNNYNQQNPQYRCQSAQKESKRSMSFGSITGINQSTTYNTNISNSTTYKEVTPTTNRSNHSDSLQISPLKKDKKVIISYKSGRSLSKSQYSFSELSQKVIKDITSKRQMNCWVKQNTSPYIEHQNTNQLLNFTKSSQFTNIILKQSINAASSSIASAPIATTKQSNLEIIPLQNQQEQQEQQKQQQQQNKKLYQPQHKLIQNLQYLKQQQKTSQSQRDQSYYPIQPFQSKFKIIHQKKILVKDVF